MQMVAMMVATMASCFISADTAPEMDSAVIFSASTPQPVRMESTPSGTTNARTRSRIARIVCRSRWS